MVKVFTYRGLTFEQLKALPEQDFTKLLTARKRRTIKRQQSKPTHVVKALMKTVRATAAAHKPVKTKVGEAIITPEFVGRVFMVYNGKMFERMDIKPEMLGHTLGEFSRTRKPIKHSGPGIGATRGTKFISVK